MLPTPSISSAATAHMNASLESMCKIRDAAQASIDAFDAAKASMHESDRASMALIYAIQDAASKAFSAF